MTSAYMALPPAILSAWHPICHTSDNIDDTCSVYNLDEYNIFHRPDKAMLFVMVKTFWCWEAFLLLKTFDHLVVLINGLQWFIWTCNGRFWVVLKNVHKMASLWFVLNLMTHLD